MVAKIEAAQIGSRCMAELKDRALPEHYSDAFRTETNVDCIEVLEQVYEMEYPITRAYADARVQRIYGGTNEIMKELIARTL
jgi:acyl-CoA dehydrogenase